MKRKIKKSMNFDSALPPLSEVNWQFTTMGISVK